MSDQELDVVPQAVQSLKARVASGEAQVDTTECLLLGMDDQIGRPPQSGDTFRNTVNAEPTRVSTVMDE